MKVIQWLKKITNKKLWIQSSMIIVQWKSKGCKKAQIHKYEKLVTSKCVTIVKLVRTLNI